MKPARLILLLVAIVAGGLAAFLVTRGGGSAPQQIVTTEVIEEAKAQILVASLPIGVGERLSPANLQWQDWPEGAVRPEYVTISAMPNAATDLTGAVARFEFFPGEPIREAKLAHSEQGYLSAVLSQGMRAVSVPVTAATAAGGFILPNDRVDVLVTTNTEAGQISEVVLSNVRVMAIGKRLGEVGVSGGQEDPAAATPTPITFDDAAIATLELDPPQAEALVTAATRGQLSLSLRSIADFGDKAPPSNSSRTVKLIRAGKEQTVSSATSVSSVSPSVVATPVPPTTSGTLPAIDPAAATTAPSALPQ